MNKRIGYVWPYASVMLDESRSRSRLWSSNFFFNL